jgi:hypothetical protein
MQTGRFDEVKKSVKYRLELFIFGAVHPLDLLLQLEELFPDVCFVYFRSKFQRLSFSLNFFPVDVREPGIVLYLLEIAKPCFGVRIK